jgi:hypothetical protein
MKALTLTQPWCGLVASGLKLVENRPKKIAPKDLFGQRFALHASRQIDDSVDERIHGIAPDVYEKETLERWRKLSVITSAILGTAILEPGVCEKPSDAETLREDQRRWFFGPIGYALTDVRPLAKAIPCRGFQGFWTVPENIAKQVLEQVGGA